MVTKEQIIEREKLLSDIKKKSDAEYVKTKKMVLKYCKNENEPLDYRVKLFYKYADEYIMKSDILLFEDEELNDYLLETINYCGLNDDYHDVNYLSDMLIDYVGSKYNDYYNNEAYDEEIAKVLNKLLKQNYKTIRCIYPNVGMFHDMYIDIIKKRNKV